MDLYSFDVYRQYSIVVEPLEDGGYEGIAYIHDHRNPVFAIKGDNGEVVRESLIDHVDLLLED